MNDTNFLGSIDKSDAYIFTSLCGFGWFIGDVAPLIFDVQESIYNNKGINFNSLTHLNDIGLLNFNNISGFKRIGLPKLITISYYGTPLNLEFQKPENNDLETGKVLLSKTGLQLSRICGSKPVDGFIDYVIEQWAKKGIVLSTPYPLNK